MAVICRSFKRRLPCPSKTIILWAFVIRSAFTHQDIVKMRRKGSRDPFIEAIFIALHYKWEMIVQQWC